MYRKNNSSNNCFGYTKVQAIPQKQQEAKPDARMYRVTIAAHILGVSRSMAYKLIESGELPAARIGKSVRIPAAKLNEYIDRKIAEGLGNAA